MYSLLSVIPYLVCFGAYIAKKEENVQKIEVVNEEKKCKLQSNPGMSDTTNSSTVKTVTTNLPGVDSSKVIPSEPIYIKENSSTPSVKGKDKK